MKRVLLILTFFYLSCSTQSNSEYSQDFAEQMQKAGIKLSADSLLFPESSGINFVLIPNQIQIDKEVLLSNESQESIFLKRINYTDFIFEYSSPMLKEKGEVSLFPHYYLGTEFRGKSESCWCSVYYQKSNSEDRKILSIDVGQNMEGDSTICVWVSFKEEIDGQSGVLF